jgi:hypothetical protein
VDRIESVLQESNIDRCSYILYFVTKKGGHKMKFSGGKYNKVEHCFGEVWIAKIKQHM